MISGRRTEATRAVEFRHARLADYTTFRLGGPCPLLIDCPTQESFAAIWCSLQSSGGPLPLLIGGGSNLLVADQGLARPVVRYLEPEPRVEREGLLVRVGAGTLLDDLARLTAEWGLDGVVMCSGIPGTVGGAIAGNAGAFGRQIGDRIRSVRALDAAGCRVTRTPEELGFSYRRSSIPALGDVLLEAELELEEKPSRMLLLERAKILALRASKHPDWHTVPTAGSFFKNIEPSSMAGRRQAAGWFLEQAGALGLRVGGARTFERHANIIIAEPGCTASNVEELAARMAAAVEDKFGLVLEREVKLIPGDLAEKDQ